MRGEGILLILARQDVARPVEPGDGRSTVGRFNALHRVVACCSSVREYGRDGQQVEFHLQAFPTCPLFHLTALSRVFDAYVIRWKNARRMMAKCSRPGIWVKPLFHLTSGLFPSCRARASVPFHPQRDRWVHRRAPDCCGAPHVHRHMQGGSHTWVRYSRTRLRLVAQQERAAHHRVAVGRWEQLAAAYLLVATDDLLILGRDRCWVIAHIVRWD
eukprot:COSAG02_NODE_3845_length_6153_cov_3.206640_3_plen_215_part_00